MGKFLQDKNLIMEQAQSLLLNELAFSRCPDPQKNIFIYEWLKYLDKILTITKKVYFKYNCFECLKMF